MSSYVYLSREVVYNNCKCCGWADKPLGLLVFSRGKRVRMVKPQGKEATLCNRLRDREEEEHYVVVLDGKRKVLGRSMLLGEAEWAALNGK